jgi:hypothetical protein
MWPLKDRVVVELAVARQPDRLPTRISTERKSLTIAQLSDFGRQV